MPNQTPDPTSDETPSAASVPLPQSAAEASTMADLLAHRVVPIRLPCAVAVGGDGSDAASGSPAEPEPQPAEHEAIIGLDLDLALVGSSALGAQSDPDPGLARTVEAGPSFDAVSVPMDLGLDTLDLLLRGGSAVGPVAADSRFQVRRVGFLLDPGTLEHSRGFAWWCRQHGVRTLTHGAVLALPRAATAPQARLLWLVPPGCGRTDPAALLACLRRAVRGGAHPSRCQASAS